MKKNKKRSTPATPFFIYLNLNSMKNFFCLIFLLSTCLIGCDNSEDDTKPEPFPDDLPVNLPDIPCQDWNIQVNIAQNLRLVNSNGEWSDLIDLNKISLSAVDQEGNLIYTPTGVPIQDMVNLAEVNKVYNEQNELDYLFIKFGYVYEETKYNYAVSYFKLKLNETRTDDIIIYWDIRCANQLLFKIVYNGTEYSANDWEIINIVVD